MSERLPTREAILAFIARERDAAVTAGQTNPGKIGKREIARAFGLKGDEKIALKRMLKDLLTEGKVEKRRSALHTPGVLPPVVLADIVGCDRDGELIAEPVEWDEALAGKAPKILVHVSRKPPAGAPVPGVGSRLLQIRRAHV